MATQIECPTMLLHPDAKAPSRGSEQAGGHDIYCVGGLEGLIDPDAWSVAQRAAWYQMGLLRYVVLMPGQGFLFRTGFAQTIHEDYVCALWDRSGMGAKKQVHRFAGLIDPDYRGEWFVRLFNHSDVRVTVKVGDKIVQGVYQERVEASFPITERLIDTTRGAQGFGSTDAPSEGVITQLSYSGRCLPEVIQQIKRGDPHMAVRLMRTDIELIKESEPPIDPESLVIDEERRCVHFKFVSGKPHHG